VAVLPWQVAGEHLSNLRKRELAGRMTASEVEAHFRNFLAMFPLLSEDLDPGTDYDGLTVALA
jgi:hypothetical protein